MGTVDSEEGSAGAGGGEEAVGEEIVYEIGIGGCAGAPGHDVE